MDERLQAELGHAPANHGEILEGVLASENDAPNAHIAQHGGAGGIVNRELGRTVDLEIRVNRTNETNQAKVLNDHGVDAALDGVAKEVDGVRELVRFHEHVQRQIDATRARMCDPARLGELVERELGTLVTGVEPLRTEVHGVGTVGDCGANGIERAGG
jgi:hypothetical protein